MDIYSIEKACWNLFEKTVKEDKVLSQYESSLENRSTYVSNLLVSSSIVEKVTQPVRLARTCIAKIRLDSVKKTYEGYRSKPLIQHFDEEDDDIAHNFYVAATYWKPRFLKKVAAAYPVPEIDKGKLLIMKKTN